jgi:hypothetical protein
MEKATCPIGTRAILQIKKKYQIAIYMYCAFLNLSLVNAPDWT